MSHLIPPGSTKTDRGIRFGKELDRAMRARGVGRRLVAAALGSSDTSIMYWRTGRMLPRIATARRLAQALAWPRLASLAVELRRKACLVDGVEFIDDSGSDNRVYCSPSCQRARQKSRVGVDRRARAATAERHLAVHQRAVAAFCAGCEPSGRCVTPECELRPVSPLPLFDRTAEIEPVQARPHNGYREPGQQAAVMSGLWARYSPQERQARIDRAAEASRRARGLAPA
jgi:transcriptional regulator with XRE-family HTH domain